MADEEEGGLYARYNLGVALIRSGAVARGSEILDEIGVVRSTSDEVLSLRDMLGHFIAHRRTDTGRAQAIVAFRNGPVDGGIKPRFGFFPLLIRQHCAPPLARPTLTRTPLEKILRPRVSGFARFRRFAE